ncbi:cation diffusion facilitator transporter [Clostridia bacterium]|nr:cation diffusion facilitator transporter [Clostridia bacterium]
MTAILAKIFIKDYKNPQNPGVRLSYGVLCGVFGVFLNAILFGGKIILGLLSRSTGLLADAFNNLFDAAGAVVSLFGFRLASRAPDSEHPFGHGRSEHVGGLIVAVITIVVAVELIRSSIEKIISSSPAEAIAFVPVFLIISIAVKFYMFVYNRRLGKKISSPALAATARDSLSDCAATILVLASSLLWSRAQIDIDGAAGVAVGLFILYNGIKSAKEAISPLLGEAPNPKMVSEVEKLVMSYEDILGVHDLLVHDYGSGRLVISLHAEVPADGNLLHLHDTIDNIELHLKTELNCLAVIHMDPVMNNDPKTLALKSKFEKFLALTWENVSLHDFRIVEGPTHTNIIFDVLTPFNFALSDESLRANISDFATTIGGGRYFTIIEVDKC